MARFAQDAIEAVKTRADIVEIIGAHVRLKRAGRNFVGLCPFHNEKTPSFSVNAERGFFHCFGCGAGGTVFDFLMRIEGLTFPEALESLARRYGIALPERADSGPGAAERDAMMRANQTAAEFFAHILWNTREGGVAREYLKSRGISDETAHAFMLGFAPARPANLANSLQKRGLLEAAIRLGLVRRDDNAGVHDMFRARLMFAIRDVQGRVIAFGGRVLDQRLPKYMNSPESPVYSKARTLYGLYEARQAIAKADRAVVVEGYIDAIALWQAGFKETVASLGTSLTVEQLRLLSRYSRNVVACFDGDEAGRKASTRALETFLGAGLQGMGVFIPRGFDPDTLVHQRGAEAFRDLLAKSELLVDYFLREQAAAARGSINARARAAERVADILRMTSNPFEFDLTARKAAEMLGVGEDVLRSEARRRGPTSGTRSAAPPRKLRTRLEGAAQAELGLLAIAMQYPHLRPEMLAQINAADFAEPMLGSMLEEVCAGEQNAAALEAGILERLNDDQRLRLSAFVVGDLIDEAAKAQALVHEYVAALGRRKRQRALENLRIKAANGDDAAAQQLVVLKRQIQDGGG